MTVRGYSRGHKTVFDLDMGRWLYEDNGNAADCDGETRPCKDCGRLFEGSNMGESDPCLGDLPGVDNACCGHGVPSEAYVRFTNGVVLKGFSVEYTEKWKG